MSLYRRSWLLAALVFLLCLLVGGGLVYQVEKNWYLDHQKDALLFGDQQVHALQHQINSSLAAAAALGAVVKHQGGELGEFDDLASSLLAYYKGISALQLAPAGVIRHIHPLAGHEKALGHDLFKDDARSLEARQAVKTRRMVMAGPFELIQGGPAVIGRYPVFFDTDAQEDFFWGFANALVRLEELLAASGLSDIDRQGYDYSLTRIHPDTGDVQRIAAGPREPDGGDLGEPVYFEVEVPGGVWILSLAPRGGWNLSPSFALLVSSTLLLSLLMAWGGYRLCRQPERLRRIVDDRTAELYLRNEELEQHRHRLAELVSVRTADLEASHEALRGSERRYRSLFETMTQGMLRYDRSGEIVEANPAASRLFGLELDEMALWSSADVRWRPLREDNLPYRDEELPCSLCLSTGKPVRDQVVGIYNPRLDEYRWMMVNAVPQFCPEGGELTHVWASFADISELKKSKELLRSREESFRDLSLQFQALLDNIPDAIFLISPRRQIVWANSCATLQFPVEGGLEDLRCCALWQEATESPPVCLSSRAMESGEMVSDEFKSLDGRIWDVRTLPIHADTGGVKSLILVARDVTRTVELKAETVRAGQLASIGELAAGVAHEINNPINGIINYGQILADSSEVPESMKTFAHEIMSEGERIAGIVRSLLSFARDRNEERSHSGIDEVLAPAIALTESQLAREGIRFLVSIKESLPQLLLHRQQLQQVFLNLISNARHALNQKFPAHHEEKTLRIDCTLVRIEGRPYLRTLFEDRGTGIPEQLLGKVMHPFFSTKGSDEGTGLGLSISHGIVTDHGGRFNIESAAGEFTRVFVDLPVAERELE